MTTRRVVVWRHGQTAWNLAGRVQGATDIPLDDEGRRQAADSAAVLAALKPTLILSSDLSRALETAEILGDLVGVPVQTEPRFREMSFGAREGLTWRQAWEAFPEGMRAWVDGDESLIPDSETHEAAGRRFAEALEEHLAATDDEVVVVVAHGGVLRAGTCSFLGIERASWQLFGGLDNCAWSILERNSHEDWVRWRVTQWNARLIAGAGLGTGEPLR